MAGRAVPAGGAGLLQQAVDPPAHAAPRRAEPALRRVERSGAITNGPERVEPDPDLDTAVTARFETASALGAATCALPGAIVLAGWAARSETLSQVLPGHVSMKPNTALAFLLGGGALAAIRSAGASATSRRAARAAASAVVAIGSLTLVEYWTGRSFGIDELLFDDVLGSVGTSQPGRMAPATAVAFLLLGVALLSIDRGNDSPVTPAQGLATSGAGIGLLALTGYLYGAGGSLGLAGVTRVAIHTSAGLLLLGASILCARPTFGLVRPLAFAGPQGMSARRFALAAVAVPVLLGALHVFGERRGWWDGEFGAALLSTSTVGVFGAVAFVATRRASELERRVADRTVQLAASLRELESFSYTVAHDLRAPLRAIAGFARALEEDCAERLDTAGLDSLARVRNAAQRMGALLDSLLELSRVSRAPVEREALDLSATAEDLADRLRRADPGRDVEVSIAPGLRPSGDRVLVELLLGNLMENSWKFTSRHECALIEVGAARDRGPGVFFVRDDGAGFDMSFSATLFGPFQRLHSDHDFPGTGIGLATVERVVRLHSGQVWAEAAVERGATFFFTLEEGSRT